MHLGEVLSRYSIVIVAVIAALALLLILIRSTDGGRKAFERFRRTFFLTRGVYAKNASGRFASAMALMLSSGLDVDESLEMVHKLLKSSALREKVETCQKNITEGQTFSQAVVNAQIFGGLHARMITVAFKTGSMDTVMEKLALRYEEETDTQISNIISVLEPSLVAVLSIIVGMILFSVMLPLMSIMSSIG
jgi:type IV pilus assembly protein PilC